MRYRSAAVFLLILAACSSLDAQATAPLLDQSKLPPLVWQRNVPFSVSHLLGDGATGGTGPYGIRILAFNISGAGSKLQYQKAPGDLWTDATPGTDVPAGSLLNVYMPPDAPRGALFLKFKVFQEPDTVSSAEATLVANEGTSAELQRERESARLSEELKKLKQEEMDYVTDHFFVAIMGRSTVRSKFGGRFRSELDGKRYRRLESSSEQVYQLQVTFGIRRRVLFDRLNNRLNFNAKRAAGEGASESQIDSHRKIEFIQQFQPNDLDGPLAEDEAKKKANDTNRAREWWLSFVNFDFHLNLYVGDGDSDDTSGSVGIAGQSGGSLELIWSPFTYNAVYADSSFRPYFGFSAGASAYASVFAATNFQHVDVTAGGGFELAFCIPGVIPEGDNGRPSRSLESHFAVYAVNYGAPKTRDIWVSDNGMSSQDIHARTNHSGVVEQERNWGMLMLGAMHVPFSRASYVVIRGEYLLAFHERNPDPWSVSIGFTITIRSLVDALGLGD